MKIFVIKYFFRERDEKMKKKWNDEKELKLIIMGGALAMWFLVSALKLLSFALR